MNKKRRVLFCGCGYGAGNIGDDAILQGLVESFRHTCQEVELGALSFNPQKTAAESGVDRVWDVGRQGTLQGFEWASHIVLGGGTLFSENPSIVFPIGHCCDIIDLAILRRKPISMLAVGSSDIRTDSAITQISEYYAQFLDVITVRSEKDRERLIKLGLAESRVYTCADSAFCAQIPSRSHWNPNGSIGISLTDKEQGDLRGYSRALEVGLSKWLRRHPDFLPMGICSEVRKKPQFDYELISMVVSSLDPDASTMCEYLNPQDFMRILSRLSLVLTMRMHILVFCALIGVPCVTVIREKKMELMLKEVGLPVELTTLSTPEAFVTVLEKAVRNPEAYIVPESKVRELWHRAIKNASIWESKSLNSGLTSSAPLKKRFQAYAKWGETIPRLLGKYWSVEKMLLKVGLAVDSQGEITRRV